MRELEAGTIVDGRYRIVTRLGSGGMADVYCAEDSQLGRRVALKILYGRFAEDDEFVERFRREASHAAGLQHQHVVSVYDRGEWDSTSYIAMEFVDGRTLKQIVQAEAPLDPLRAIDLIVQVLRAARFAHRRGVIHRDLKPHNVMVDHDDRAKVTDFGIARAGASDMTQTGSIMGTAQYLSPEQAQGHPVSEASDLYSVGIVLYELVTGRVPFDGDSAVAIALKQVNEAPVPPSHLNPALPGPLEDAILRALAKDPADRYADADAFIADLEEARRRIVAGTAAPSQATAAFEPVVPVPAPVPYDPAWDTMPPGPLLDEERVREERKWPWVLLVALLLAAAIVGAALLLGGGTKVKVPGVVGKPSTEAATLLHAAGFEVSSDPTQSAQPRGTVIHQDPVAGTSAKKGTTVTLAVSSGPGAKQVPIVDGLGRNAARNKLKAAGFRVGPDRLQASDTVAKDHVISTSPPGGTPVDVGGEVQLLVSTGPAVVPVPSVVGKPVEDASSTLRDAGFDVALVDKPDDTKDPGTVLAQDPASGTAPRGSTVRLTVARAPDTAVIPDETGEKSADAIAALSGAGFTVKTKPQDVSQTDGDDTVLAQSPSGGATKKAKKGSTVTITIGHYVAPATTPATTPTTPPTTTPTVP